MSFRKPAADKAEKNRTILKSLVRKEENKTCADCKVQKHPRWASWNLGVFICIRCSGIHRSLGVHISKVRSIDLDSWTDDQVENMQRWGNLKANEYWEAKMKKNHIPADEKMTSFIRTKYESGRWAMECTPEEAISAFAGQGDLPTTTTTANEDDIPLGVVRERALSSPKQMSRRPGAPPAADLLGIDSAFDPTPSPSPATVAPPPQQEQKKDSLSGLRMFGSGQNSRTGSPGPGAGPPLGNKNPTNREDLKKSILSLYATQSPKPQATVASSSVTAAASSGGIMDAFSSLTLFSSNSSKPSSSGNAISGSNSIPASSNLTPKSDPVVLQVAQPSTGPKSGDLFDLSFNDSFSSAAAPPKPSTVSPPSRTVSVPPAAPQSSFPSLTSAFNISSSKPATTPASKPATASTSLAGLPSHLANPWATDSSASKPVSAPAPAPEPAVKNPVGDLPSKPALNSDFSTSNWATEQSLSGGFGSSFGADSWKPTVTQDEDFSDWTSAVPPVSAPKPKGFVPEDLYSNVWS